MKDEIRNILTRNYKEDMIKYFKSNPDQINDLLNLIFENNDNLSWRAAWLIWSCVEANDERISANSSRFIDMLGEANESMQRELLKILYDIDISEDNLGKLFNTCISIWESIDKRPGVRYCSIKMIFKIIESYPELKNEIEYLLDDRFMNTLSPGIRHSLKKFYLNSDKFNKIVI